ncbi:MAG: Gfo/Idh/MocA family oxidoreductase [Calditrichaeota bacterium]|nr:Gfo/Idh/MocA family oxidoreductase [Calditrichota bacterium]
MAKKIGVGILGVGGIAQLVHIPLLRKHPEVELVAVCDLDRQKAALVAQKNKIPLFHRDAEHFLRTEKLEAVFICTPTNSHMALTLAALSAGKHVFLEKPAARNHNEAKRTAKAAAESKSILMVAMNHRFRPDSMILRNFIEANELGKMTHVRAGWLKKKDKWTRPMWVVDPKISGGGVMMDLGIQMLDICLWLLGNPKVEAVSATAARTLPGKKVEDTVLAFYRLQGGIGLAVDTSWSLMSDESIAYTRFHGTEGAAALNPLRITKQMHGELVNVTPGKMQRPAELYKKSFEFEVDHFIQCIQHKRKPISTIEGALEIMTLVEATYRSVAENREVTVIET